MTLKNRVDPWGRLHAAEARGTLLGNRGILHNAQKQVVSQWKGKGWVTCLLDFRGRKRTVFGVGTYSELFFLDEATAFSAGHRPCAECQRERYNEFKLAWVKANRGLVGADEPPIAAIDKIMHSERAQRGGDKVTFDARINELPPGTFFEIGGEAHIVWHGAFLRWTFHGYRDYTDELGHDSRVCVLTPRSIVQMFRSEFVPYVHPSAENC